MRKTARDPLASLLNINEFIESGSQITIGNVDPIKGVAVASDDHNCLAMLRRRPNESLFQLLVRLDAAIGRAWEEDFYTDEINSHN